MGLVEARESLKDESLSENCTRTMRSPSSSVRVSTAEQGNYQCDMLLLRFGFLVAMNTMYGKENTSVDCLMFNNRRLIQQAFGDERGRNASVEFP
ncbi:hypothetical protein EIK77_006919 [Talaromyces pinophilus]|nr:hypothetical protein EIK77_006919 [Talaromyces pinophilus]